MSVATEAQSIANASSLRVAAPNSGAGLLIDATFGPSVTSRPNAAAIENSINLAIGALQARFKNPITVHIFFRYAATEADNTTPLDSGTLARSNYLFYNITWANYINALTASATTSNDAVANAHLPGAPLTTNFEVSSANGRAVGLNTPVGMNSTGGIGSGGNFIYDGIITINSQQAFQFTRPTLSGNYDAQRSIEHEIDEVLGLGSYLPSDPNVRPQDLFSYSAPGVRSILASGTRYFSIDGGVTNIVGFNQDSNGDFGDWFSDVCPQIFPSVQNAFSCDGQYTDVTATSPEGINLDVIGYDLVTSIPITDFNADGATDIVLQNTSTGEVAQWLMKGPAISAGAVVGSPGVPWSVIATGDFDGDGKSDVVLRNAATGDVAVWLLNGSVIKGGAVIGTPGTSWSVVGVGDFNFDGKSDVLLRNTTTGSFAIWLMNGLSITGSAILGSPGSVWSAVAIADLNGDGHSDIVLQNVSGDVAVWLMNGAAIASGAVIGTGGGYNVVAAGDLDGDGKADIVLRNTTGDVACWIMNGLTITSGAVIGTPGTSWLVLGTGDYNDDGRADILLRSNTGNVAQWLMTGSTITGGGVIANPGVVWTAVAK